jgi:hypothetical protein
MDVLQRVQKEHKTVCGFSSVVYPDVPSHVTKPVLMSLNIRRPHSAGAIPSTHLLAMFSTAQAGWRPYTDDKINIRNLKDGMTQCTMEITSTCEKQVSKQLHYTCIW